MAFTLHHRVLIIAFFDYEHHSLRFRRGAPRILRFGIVCGLFTNLSADFAMVVLFWPSIKSPGNGMPRRSVCRAWSSAVIAKGFLMFGHDESGGILSIAGHRTPHSLGTGHRKTHRIAHAGCSRTSARTAVSTIPCDLWMVLTHPQLSFTNGAGNYRSVVHITDSPAFDLWRCPRPAASPPDLAASPWSVEKLWPSTSCHAGRPKWWKALAPRLPTVWRHRPIEP